MLDVTNLFEALFVTGQEGSMTHYQCYYCYHYYYYYYYY